MKQRFFTIVELMAVIMIIGVLVGLITVLLPQMRERGRRVQCANNLKNMGGAIIAYADDHGSILPFGDDAREGMSKTGIINNQATLKGSGMKSFRQRLLPYLKTDEIFSCPSVNRNTEREYVAFSTGDDDWNYSFELGETRVNRIYTTDHYTRLNIKLRSSELIDGLPLCADLYNNHTTPNSYGNVLYGDGSVQGHFGTIVSGWETAWERLSVKMKAEFPTWQDYKKFYNEFLISAGGSAVEDPIKVVPWSNITPVRVTVSRIKNETTNTKKVIIQKINLLQNLPWAIPRLGY